MFNFDINPDEDPQLIPANSFRRYKQNDLAARSEVNEHDYSLLTRKEFEDILDPKVYNAFVAAFPKVVFIDLGDFDKYIKADNDGLASKGFEAIDIQTIADVVCFMFGNDSEIHEVMWSTFDENVNSVVMAKLGLDEEQSLSTDSFSNAMDVVFAITDVIQRYLINAGYPLIGQMSIYAPVEYKNGIIALQLRTHVEITDLY